MASTLDSGICQSKRLRETITGDEESCLTGVYQKA